MVPLSRAVTSAGSSSPRLGQAIEAQRHAHARVPALAERCGRERPDARQHVHPSLGRRAPEPPARRATGARAGGPGGPRRGGFPLKGLPCRFRRQLRHHDLRPRRAGPATGSAPGRRCHRGRSGERCNAAEPRCKGFVDRIAVEPALDLGVAHRARAPEPEFAPPPGRIAGGRGQLYPAGRRPELGRQQRPPCRAHRPDIERVDARRQREAVEVDREVPPRLCPEVRRGGSAGSGWHFFRTRPELWPSISSPRIAKIRGWF